MAIRRDRTSVSTLLPECFDSAACRLKRSERSSSPLYRDLYVFRAVLETAVAGARMINHTYLNSVSKPRHDTRRRKVRCVIYHPQYGRVDYTLHPCGKRVPDRGVPPHIALEMRVGEPRTNRSGEYSIGRPMSKSTIQKTLENGEVVFGYR